MANTEILELIEFAVSCVSVDIVLYICYIVLHFRVNYVSKCVDEYHLLLGELVNHGF